MRTFASTYLPRFPLDQRAQGKFFLFIPMSKVPNTDRALTYAEQIARLKKRGLVFENEAKALHLLELISYYRLSNYWNPLISDKETKNFYPGSTFETAFDIYKFDRELRLLVVRELEKIEVAVRAKMIYILSHNRGPFWYTNSNNFSNPVDFSITLSKIANEFNRSDDSFVKEFKKEYSDPLPPSWIMMETSSFGVLSNLYSNLVPGKDKRAIAHYFGVKDDVFVSWLHSIVYIRNICAHHSRLWNRYLRIKAIVPKSLDNLWLVNNSIENKRVYFVLSMIIYLMNTINPKHSIQAKLKTLLENFPAIKTEAMGFPVNWEEEPLWKR